MSIFVTIFCVVIPFFFGVYALYFFISTAVCHCLCNFMSHTIVNMKRSSIQTRKNNNNIKLDAEKKIERQKKLQLAFSQCHFVCGFFTLIGPLRHIKNARRNKKIFFCVLDGKGCEKCSAKKMTAINHSCWASFKYKSISIFHFFFTLLMPLVPLPPSSSHQCLFLNAMGSFFLCVIKKGIFVEGDGDSDITIIIITYTAYWSAYKICHFFNTKKNKTKKKQPSTCIITPAEKYAWKNWKFWGTLRLCWWETHF